MIQELQEGQIVLCTVDKIVGTIVFVKIENNSEGTIVTPEISPGRIRNLRDYVVPGKKIVCKILKIKDKNIYLSLRRVKQNEKKEFLNQVKKEKNFKAILKTVLGKQEAEKIINEIIKTYFILDFSEEIKTSPKILEKYTTKQQAKKILKILESKKEKPKQIRQIFKLSNKSSQGIIIIKKIIQDANKNSKADISYLAAGKYRITITGQDFKQLKTQINSILQKIKKQAKKQGCEFSVEKS